MVVSCSDLLAATVSHGLGSGETITSGSGDDGTSGSATGVNTYGTAKVNMTDGEIAQQISKLFDLRPKAIEDNLKLRNPMYEETASYGHLGRTPEVVTKTFITTDRGIITKEVELFTWEKLDRVENIKTAFGI